LWPLRPLNRPALGVILSRNAGFGQGVEKGGFANVGQTHDAAFEAHEIFLLNQDPSCDIDPNMGVVEVPGPPMKVLAEAQGHTDRNLAKPEIFVLVLSWGEWA